LVKKSYFPLIYALLFFLYFAYVFHKSPSERKYGYFGTRALLSSRIALFFFLLAVCRLIHIQLKNSDAYSEAIRRQSGAFSLRRGRRGEIFDSAGRPLAWNSTTYEAAVDPSRIHTKPEIAKALGEIFDLPFISGDKDEFIASLVELAKINRKYKRIEKNLTEGQRDTVSDLIEKNGLRKNEIYFGESVERINERYRNIVGYVGYTDGAEDEKTGIFGIEKAYDAYLREKTARQDRQVVRDRSKSIPTTEPVMQKQINGKNIYLTIDSDVQIVLTEEIEKQFAATKAEAAYGLVLDPRDGRVLASVSLYSAGKALRNGTFQDQIEPGSIFKSVVMSAALNEDLVKPGDTFNIGDGTLTRVGHTIRETTKTLKGVITAEEILTRSSNTGMVQVGEKFSNKTFEDYLQKFGFYERTGVDFPNELRPRNLPMKSWNLLTKVNRSFGQGIVMTPIQMAVAFAAVINGGVRYRPYLVERIEDENGVVIRRNVPAAVDTVIKPETSELMKSMLEQAVQKGTGTRAQIKGYRIGGKTGTGQIASPKGGYLPDDYLASFVGFFPVDKPAYVVLVMFVKPNRGKKIEEKYGGAVAAPVFAEIGKRIIKIKGILPAGSAEAMEIKSIGQTTAEINGIIKPNRRRVEGNRMPDLTGLSAREVINVFFDTGIAPEIEGTGLVESQSPAPGAALFGVEAVKVVLTHEIKIDIPAESSFLLKEISAQERNP
jgi:cell division protein FtsI (penicillin-binding protein 3)